MPVGGASSGGASAGAVRAGGAYVEAFLKDNRLVRGLEGVRRRMSAFGSFMMGIGRRAAIAGALIAAPLIGAAKHFADTGDQLNKMSQRTGVSVETLSQLAYAAGQSGSSIEELGVGMKGMAKFTDAVDRGSKEAVATLENLGITVDEFMSSSPEKRFELLADGINAVVDPQLKAAAAMDVFGKAGEGMLPMLEGGAVAIDKLRMEADSLGKTVTKEQAENATKLGDAWDRVKAATLGAVFVLGSQLAPGLELVAGWLKDVGVGIGDFLRENKALAVILGAVVAGLFASAAASFVLGIAMKGLALGVGIVTLAFTILGGVIGFLLSPIGLVVAAIAGIGALFVTQTKAGQEFATDTGRSFQNIADTAKHAWGGIAAAIQKGDLETAAQIALTTLRLAWAETILYLTEKWVWFKKTFRDGWADLGTGISLIWNDLTSALAKALAWVLDKALWLFRNTIGLIFDGLAWAARKLGATDTAKTLAEIGNLRFDSPDVQRVIEEDRVRKRDQILADAAKAQRERDLFRAKQIADAQADVFGIRAELNRLIAKAHEQPGGAGVPAAGPGESTSKPGGIDHLGALGTAAKGLFNAPNWKQALGIGDKVNEKQLTEAKKANIKLDQIARALLNVGVFRIK